MYKELSLFMGINVNGFRELPPPPTQETSVFMVSSEGLPQRILGIAEANPIKIFLVFQVSLLI